MEWENSLNALTVCCSSHSATQVDGLTPVQEAAVAVFSFAEHWTLWLLQCSLAALLSGATWCVWVCVSNCVNSPEASMGVAACPTAADVCWMDKSTHNPLGLAAGSCHGPFLLFAFLFFLVFSSLSASLSLSLFLSRRFLRFFTCVLFIFHFSFFCIIFLVLAKPTEELAITTVVGNLLPAFQYTHRHTFAHSSTYTIPCSSPNANKPKTTTQHRGLHFPLPPGRGGFKTFEAHPHSDLSLREKAPVSCCKIKIKGLGLSLEDLHLTLF